MIVNYLNLIAVFIKTFLFIKTKVFVVNSGGIKNCNNFIEAPSIINENVRNVLFHSYCKKFVSRK